MKIFVLCCIFVLHLTQLCHGVEWSDFKRKHILDPETTLYQNFKREDWNDWYRNRNRTGRVVPTNTVLIGNDSSILNLFENGNTRWMNGSTVIKDFFWSTKSSPMFVMKLQNTTNDYDVYNCLEGYFFVAKVDMLARPIHFHGYAENIGLGLVKDTSRCTIVQGNYSNYLYPSSILSLTVFAVLSIFLFQ